MEINLHVCLPELGLTASLAMLGLCERSADLDRFRTSSSFSDWQQCNRGLTETYHNSLYNSSRFHSFCYFLHWHQNYSPIFIPSTNFSYDFSLRERKKKLAFTLLPYCSGTKLLNIYTLHCHILGEEVTSSLGDIILQCQELGSNPNGGINTANHMQMELTF